MAEREQAKQQRVRQAQNFARTHSRGRDVLHVYGWMDGCVWMDVGVYVCLYMFDVDAI